MINSNTFEKSIDDYLKSVSADDTHNLGFDKHSLSPAHKQLINKLVERHGEGEVFRSKRGSIELRIATPHLLETDGEKELLSRHLFVNIDKVIKEDHMMAARCVKDGRLYNVRELLSMLPIEKRALNIAPGKVKKRVKVFDRLRFMEKDEAGNLVPPGPGTVVPLTDLASDHPAVEYVQSRGFSCEALVKQFRASYCTEENPKMIYKKLPNGMSGTSQGRIIFYIDQLGVCRGWQGRQLDRWEDHNFQIWHPYRQEFVTVAALKDGLLQVLPEYDGALVGKSSRAVLQQKYTIGLGVEKSMTIMGFDAALEWSKCTGVNTIGIVEGVLDAARLGPPFCSIMGLNLSPNQGALIKNHFSSVVFITDRDEDTEKADIFRESVNRTLGGSGVNVREVILPDRVKDAGDLTATQAAELLEKIEELK